MNLAVTLSIGDLQGQTAAHHASSSCQEDFLEQLSSYNVDLLETADAYGCNTAHIAAMEGHETVLITLFEAKADLSSSDSTGVTPSCCATWHGHAHVLHLLDALNVDMDGSASGSTGSQEVMQVVSELITL